MDFFEGFLIGRLLAGNRGPRRHASSGTALPLYGGAFMIGVGIVMAYWTDAPASPASYVVGFAGLFFLVLGYVLDRSFRSEERRQYDQHYTSQPQQRSSA